MPATNVSSNIIFKSSQSGGAAAERMRIDSNGHLRFMSQGAGVVGSGSGNTGMTIFSGADSY